MAITFIPDRYDDYTAAGQTYPGLKELKINELRALYKKIESQRTEGIALVKYYRAYGPATTSGDLRVPKPVPKVTDNPTYPLHTTNAADDAFSVNTSAFLDHYFPNGGKKSASAVKFYTQTLVSGAYVPVYNRSVAHGEKYVDNLVSKSKTFWYNTLKGKDRDKRVISINNLLPELAQSLVAVEKQINALGGKVSDTPATTATTPDPYGYVHDYSNAKLEYNVGMVQEAYFSSGQDFQNLTNMLKGANKPTSVTAANELWKDSKSNKGMIWLYTDGGKKDDFTVISTTQKPKDSTFKKYAFQFHYNPGTLDMAWAGSPDVDVAMESSGLERFNLLGEHTMSTISFDLVLNRIFDFQYYTKDGKLKPGRRGDRNPYAPVQPSASEQKRIYEYGTMYDVEYLLSTILGYKLDTRFRGTTSDIGFLTGRPVDLHLGHKLRYWGYIGAVSVSHRIFDERMVPIFSTVSITFNRIPDYQV